MSERESLDKKERGLNRKERKRFFERISTVVDPIFFITMVLALIVGIMFGIYRLLGWL